MQAAVLAAVLGVCGLTGCTVGDTEFVMSTGILNGRSVCTVDNLDVSLEEAKLYLCNYKNLYGSVYGVDLWDYDFGERSLQDYVKAVTISELGRIVCMDLLAEEQGITLSEDEKKQVKKAAKKYHNSLTDAEQDYLRISVKQLEEYYTHYALADKLYNTLTSSVEEEISDDEARVMRVQQIYTSSMSKADEVAAKLAAGAGFEETAQAYNEAAEYETTVARGSCDETVEDVVFSLSDGDVSNRIDTSEGTFFYRCVSKFDQELTEENKQLILSKKEREQFDSLYADYVKRASTHFNETLWNETTIDPAKEITTNSFFEVYDSCMNKEQ